MSTTLQRHARRLPFVSRRRWLAATAGASLGLLAGCGGGDDPVESTLADAMPLAADDDKPDMKAQAFMVTATRTWRMGFSRVPPAASVPSLLDCLARIRGRADFVVMQEHVAWADLLAGAAPETLVERDLAPVADHVRSLGLEVVLLLELTNGIARGQEVPALVALRRSLTEPAVQQAYARYAAAANRRIRPLVLGLATETNAVRLLAPGALYQAVVKTAADAARAVRAEDSARKLAVSVQVEVAWGRMPGQSRYEGLARDFADFAFAQVIGLSSYPYLAYSLPESIPTNYYSRLFPAGSKPAMVVEGGWPSASQGRITSSPAIQARYLNKQMALLDSVRAHGVAQLMLADLDLSQWSPEVASAMSTFASLGVLDSSFQPKAAASVWDQLYRRRWRG